MAACGWWQLLLTHHRNCWLIWQAVGPLLFPYFMINGTRIAGVGLLISTIPPCVVFFVAGFFWAHADLWILVALEVGMALNLCFAIWSSHALELQMRAQVRTHARPVRGGGKAAFAATL